MDMKEIVWVVRVVFVWFNKRVDLTEKERKEYKMSLYTDITIQQFIDMLINEVAEEDRDIAKIEFFIKQNGEEKDLDIKSVSGFSISPDIVIELEEVKKSLIAPANFKQSFIKMQNMKSKNASTIGLRDI